MGKDQELLEAARKGNAAVVEKILGQRAKRSGPLARWVYNQLSNCRVFIEFLCFANVDSVQIGFTSKFKGPKVH